MFQTMLNSLIEEEIAKIELETGKKIELPALKEKNKKMTITLIIVCVILLGTGLFIFLPIALIVYLSKKSKLNNISIIAELAKIHLLITIYI